MSSRNGDPRPLPRSNQIRFINFSELPLSATREDVQYILDATKRTKTNASFSAPPSVPAKIAKKGKGKYRSNNFVSKLYTILAEPAYTDIIHWLPHGRSWVVVDNDAFIQHVAPQFFTFKKYSSFSRQISGWGFRRKAFGQDRNSYYHELFMRGRPHLVALMKREGDTRSVKDATSMSWYWYDQEPNFYELSKNYPLPNNPNGIGSSASSSSSNDNYGESDGSRSQTSILEKKKKKGHCGVEDIVPGGCASIVPKREPRQMDEYREPSPSFPTSHVHKHTTTQDHTSTTISTHRLEHAQLQHMHRPESAQQTQPLMPNNIVDPAIHYQMMMMQQQQHYYDDHNNQQYYNHYQQQLCEPLSVPHSHALPHPPKERMRVHKNHSRKQLSKQHSDQQQGFNPKVKNPHPRGLNPNMDHPDKSHPGYGENNVYQYSAGPSGPHLSPPQFQSQPCYSQPQEDQPKDPQDYPQHQTHTNPPDNAHRIGTMDNLEPLPYGQPPHPHSPYAMHSGSPSVARAQTHAPGATDVMKASIPAPLAIASPLKTPTMTAPASPVLASHSFTSPLIAPGSPSELLPLDFCSPLPTSPIDSFIFNQP